MGRYLRLSQVKIIKGKCSICITKFKFFKIEKNV